MLYFRFFVLKSIYKKLNFNLFDLYLIVSITGPAYKGILLQARTVQNGTAEGMWNLPDGGNFKLLNCNSLTSSALTHANNTEKTNQSFIWNAPNVLSATNYTI